MIKRFWALLLIAVITIGASAGCKKKTANKVPIDQINPDGSTNYEYLFQNSIEEEKKRDERLRKNPFRE